MLRVAREFLARPAEEVAPGLLGCVLVRVLDDGTRVSGRIVETEAYLGVVDKAAHSYGGRRTARNEAMYARAGTAYVYFTYGLHHCFNVVCGDVDEPVAVLVRALEPLEGMEAMRAHRAARRIKRNGRMSKGARQPDPVRGRVLREQDLCSGPAKLCQALAIDRALCGADLITSDAIWLERGAKPIPAAHIGRSPRIGVDYAGAWAKRRLRWFVRGSACVRRQ